MAAPDLSIVIPVFNEETAIGSLLDSLSAFEDVQLIVVDGGSTDNTVALAAGKARIVQSARGRAIQMNAGAKIATGRALLFLHADTRPGPSFLDEIRRVLDDDAIVGGNFDIRYEGGDWIAEIFTRVNRWRRHLGIIYGDSGIFCRMTVFDQLAGYRPWPIMEDYDFAQRLSKAGKLALLDEPIWVSDRRWRKAGLLRTLWSWFVIQGLYSLGVRPQRLAAIYKNVR